MITISTNKIKENRFKVAPKFLGKNHAYCCKENLSLGACGSRL